MQKDPSKPSNKGGREDFPFFWKTICNGSNIIEPSFSVDKLPFFIDTS